MCREVAWFELTALVTYMALCRSKVHGLHKIMEGNYVTWLPFLMFRNAMYLSVINQEKEIHKK